MAIVVCVAALADCVYVRVCIQCAKQLSITAHKQQK